MNEQDRRREREGAGAGAADTAEMTEGSPTRVLSVKITPRVARATV